MASPTNRSFINFLVLIYTRIILSIINFISQTIHHPCTFLNKPQCHSMHYLRQIYYSIYDKLYSYLIKEEKETGIINNDTSNCPEYFSSNFGLDDEKDEEIKKKLLEDRKEALDQSSKLVRRLIMVFLLVGMFGIALFLSITHIDLFFNNRIQLPLFNIKIPVWHIFAWGPPLWVVLHINVLIQAHFLSGRARRFYNSKYNRRTLRQFQDTLFPQPMPLWVVRFEDQRRKKAEAELLDDESEDKDSKRPPPLLNKFLMLTTLFSLIIFPWIVLVTALIRFLPYHDSLVTTLIHKGMIVLDSAFVFFYFVPRIFLRPMYGKRSKDILTLKQKSSMHLLFILSILPCIFFVFDGEWPLRSSTKSVHVSTPTFWDTWLDPIPKWVRSTDGGYQKEHPWITEKVAEYTPFNLNLSRQYLIRVVPTDLAKSVELIGNLNISTEQIHEGNDKNGSSADDSKQNATKKLSPASKAMWSLAMKANLRERNFRRANLRNAYLGWSDLTDSDLSYAFMEDTTLENARLINTSLYRTALNGSRFRNGKIGGSDFTNADLRKANFHNVQIYAPYTGKTYIEFQYIIRDNDEEYEKLPEYTIFKGADLSEVTFHGGQLKSSDLSYANLKRVKFHDTFIINSNFRHANLTETKYIIDGQITSGYSKEVNKNESNVCVSDFSGAIFDQADWQGIEFKGVELGGIVLNKEIFKSSKFKIYVDKNSKELKEYGRLEDINLDREIFNHITIDDDIAIQGETTKYESDLAIFHKHGKRLLEAYTSSGDICHNKDYDHKRNKRLTSIPGGHDAPSDAIFQALARQAIDNNDTELANALLDLNCTHHDPDFRDYKGYSPSIEFNCLIDELKCTLNPYDSICRDDNKISCRKKATQPQG